MSYLLVKVFADKGYLATAISKALKRREFSEFVSIL